MTNNPNRDPRIPPPIESRYNSMHDFQDRRMDAYFEDICVTRKGANIVYIIIDIALIGFAYRVGDLSLIFFTLISVACCVLHLILILLLPTSRGRKKRIVGVARMTCFDPATRTQVTNPTPLRRFALLSHCATMPRWHIFTMIDISVPLIISLLIAFIYFMLTVRNAFYLSLFLSFRFAISLSQYRTLKNFYADAISASFSSVMVSDSATARYATSRANAFVNNDLDRANDYLRGHRRGARTHAPKVKKRDSQNASFSGISLDGMQTEVTPASGIQHV